MNCFQILNKKIIIKKVKKIFARCARGVPFTDSSPFCDSCHTPTLGGYGATIPHFPDSGGVWPPYPLPYMVYQWGGMVCSHRGLSRVDVAQNNSFREFALLPIWPHRSMKTGRREAPESSLGNRARADHRTIEVRGLVLKSKVDRLHCLA